MWNSSGRRSSRFSGLLLVSTDCNRQLALLCYKLNVIGFKRLNRQPVKTFGRFRGLKLDGSGQAEALDELRYRKNALRRITSATRA